MKMEINGITYNSESAKLLKEWTGESGGRKLMMGTQGKAKGKLFILSWEHPYYREVGIMPIEEEDIDGYVWDNECYYKTKQQDVMQA